MSIMSTQAGRRVIRFSVEPFTVSNGRYVTMELKERERRVLHARAELLRHEQLLFGALRQVVRVRVRSGLTSTQ
jgi:hypothetical protein